MAEIGTGVVPEGVGGLRQETVWRSRAGAQVLNWVHAPSRLEQSPPGEARVRVVTIIDLPRITIIDGRGRLQIVRVPVASSLSAPNHSYQRIDGASVRLRWQESPHCN